MDADAPNAISPSLTMQAEQHLTAPPGWTKKLVPAKGKNVTLRKHDVVFVAPDGQEVPSQWHLRRYLKAHPDGPVFSDFDWNSGEESVRRSPRVSTRELNVTEALTPTTKRKAKVISLDLDADGAEEVKARTPARKRAKKADKPEDTAGASASKDEALLPGKDEVMDEVMDEAGETPVSGKPENQDAAPVTDVKKEVDAEKVLTLPVSDSQKEGSDAEKVLTLPVTDSQKEGSDAEKAPMRLDTDPMRLDTDAQKSADAEKVSDEAKESQGEAENEPSIIAMNVLVEKESKVVEGEKSMEVKEQDQEVKTIGNESQLVSELKGESGLISNDKFKGEEVVVKSEKLLEPAGETVVELKESFTQKDDHKVMSETHVSDEREESEKKSLELLMQKEEQERLHSVHNSPGKVDHTKEKNPSELSSSPVPLSVGNH